MITIDGNSSASLKTGARSALLRWDTFAVRGAALSTGFPLLDSYSLKSALRWPIP
jgi:hypothetical protein